MTIDTIITADGSPGPYNFTSWFIDTATLKVAPVNDSVAGGLLIRSLPPYAYSEPLNALLFAAPLDSGLRFCVHCKTAFNGLAKTYALFPRAYLDKSDTAANGRGAPYADTNSGAGLDMNGYKSVSVGLSGLGEVTIAQALDVRLHGDIAQNTRLSGHISDQGSSLDGATREVNELDMVYVALDNPRFGVVLGDQYLSWIPGGILAMDKKIKGIAARASAAGAAITGFGAISSGKFASQLIRGRMGMQGPYRLLGNNEAALILPQHGTVKVWLKGKRIEEGAGVTVDYEQGTVTIQPTHLVGDGDVIRVEYEYRVSDYQRLLWGAGQSYASSDSHFVTRGTLWYETDAPDAPLDLVLDNNDLARCAAAGDSAPEKPSGQLIPENDVARENALMPLYTRDSSGRYAYTPYDPQNPRQRSGFYHVWFRPLSGGEYTADSGDFRGPIYRYVGRGLGTATAAQPIPLPERTVLGEIKSAYRPFAWLTAQADVAGRSYDRNLFSGLNDRDNNDAAVSARVLAGKKSLLEQSFFMEAGQTYIGRDFSAIIFKQIDRGRLWDDTSTTVSGAARRLYEAAAGITAAGNLGIQCEFGRLQAEDAQLAATDKMAVRALAPLSRQFVGDYNGNFFRHDTQAPDKRVRKDELTLRYTNKTNTASLGILDEWRQGHVSGKRGMLGVSLNGANRFLKESFAFSAQRKGGQTIVSAADTGTELTWLQSFDGQIRPEWNCALNTSYHRKTILPSSVSSEALCSITDDYGVRTIGLRSHQEYSVTLEQASRLVAMPVYVGAGLGNYGYSDSIREYVPRIGGDFYLNRTEVADAANGEQMQKTRLQFSASLDALRWKIPGILGDLAWQGDLLLEEHCTPGGSQRWALYLPGYTTLRASPADSSIRYSQCNARVRADWEPAGQERPHGFASFSPFINFQTRLLEQGATWRFGADRRTGPWLLESELELNAVRRLGRLDLDNSDNAAIADRSLLLHEQYRLAGPYYVFCKQYGGWAAQRGVFNATAGYYGRLQPGSGAQFGSNGRAEISYALTQVSLNGDLDWRIAQGSRPGRSHVIEGNAAIMLGNHFSLDGSLRSEFGRSVKDAGYNNGLHSISVSGRAYL